MWCKQFLLILKCELTFPFTSRFLSLSSSIWSNCLRCLYVNPICDRVIFQWRCSPSGPAQNTKRFISQTLIIKLETNSTYDLLLWDVMQHLNLEKIRSTLQGSTAKFSRSGNPLLNMLECQRLYYLKCLQSFLCVATCRDTCSVERVQVFPTFLKCWVQIYVIDPPYFNL